MSDSSPAVLHSDPASPTAADVVRGVCRLFLRHDLVALGEVPLEGGRRVDLMAMDGRGKLVIVEIKVSRADLLGDGKWTEYLDHCDRFYWAVPQGFDLAPFARPEFQPDRAGLIVADRYDGAILREASESTVSSAARRRTTLAFARRAARRLIKLADPDADIDMR
ncbi:MmcB family DNA repair protein [Stakelama tenebrarum]|uniref:MmcB family DNA repair protein n=1 Tax=Stakelama tenebrarum TaxID=2711215 RepID=A0A6G6Y0U6_9SPHN|nr:MmcB family DNA repair protein [Sphingosinithalassobacter tenebrarum]QIG78530.1 MmcB family DNA repair protein [Sphingosinithalassobacter tenebrarum]